MDGSSNQLLAIDSFRDTTGPATCKLFFFGQRLQRAELEDQLRKLMVPACFVPVADLVTEFGDDVADMPFVETPLRCVGPQGTLTTKAVLAILPTLPDQSSNWSPPKAIARFASPYV